METNRETPSTHISLALSHPPVYEVRRTSTYHGIISPSLCSPYLCFPIDSLYQFPLIDGQISKNDVHALISSSLFTHTKGIDMNYLLECLHINSPFKKTQHYTRIPIHESSDLYTSGLEAFSETDSSVLNNSYLNDSSSALSGISRADIPAIDEKDKEAILNILRDFHSRPGNERQLNSLTPASSPSIFSPNSSQNLDDFDSDSFEKPEFNQPFIEIDQQDDFIIPEDCCISLAEEGSIQTIKCTLEVEALASKNIMGSHHIKPELVKLPPKSLTSMNSPYTSLVQEISYYHPTSPILRKLVFCHPSNDSQDVLEIIASVCTTGFSTALVLEYSNVEIQNKACVDYKKNDRLLLTNKIARALSNNGAIWFSCGFEHCAIVTNDGKIMTWGYGASGCLGHGDTNSCGFPKIIQSVTTEVFRYIECGGYHTLAISDASEIYMWGRGDVHQLGIPHRQLCKDEHGYVALKPLKLDCFTKKIKGGACGEAHTLVLDEEGSIYAFGWGEDGQLGVIPAEVEGIKYKGITQVDFSFKSAVVKVAAGHIFSACLTDQGEVYVWGNGDKGQFGKEIDNDFICNPQKIDIEGNVLDIVCGESRVICVTDQGVVYGWGLGRAGYFSSQSQNFATGSELVCYSPKILGEADIIHHLMI